MSDAAAASEVPPRDDSLRRKAVPGSFIRVRQGDTVEFHLKNHPSSKMPHSIDLHGVTGPGGDPAFLKMLRQALVASD